MLRSNPLIPGAGPIDEEKRKQMMLERKREYDDFKRQQDEKFRNRFKNKSTNDIPASFQARQITESPLVANKSVPLRNALPSDTNSEMAKKLEDIQSQLNNFLSASNNNKSQFNTASNDASFKGDEVDQNELSRQYNYIQEMEQKLKQLETNYYEVPSTPRQNFVPKKPSLSQPPVLRNTPKKSSDAQTKGINKKSLYRMELEQQIQEKKQKMKESKEEKTVEYFDYFTPEKPRRGGPQLPNSIPNNIRRTSEVRDSRMNMSEVSVSRNISQDFSSQNQKSRTSNYADELKKQIEETKQRKEQEKAQQQAFERKKDREIADYNPFFDKRGGGGDPLIKPGKSEPRAAAPVVMYQKPPETNARGGNGIFGNPHSETDKRKTQNYKQLLMEQIEEKKRLLQEKKAREAEEEAKIERNFQQYHAKLNKDHERQEKNRMPKSYQEPPQNTISTASEPTKRVSNGVEIYQPSSVVVPDQVQTVRKGDYTKRPESPSLYITEFNEQNNGTRRVRSSEENKKQSSSIMFELNSLKKSIAEEKVKIEKMIQVKKYNEDREIYELEEKYKNVPPIRTTKKVNLRKEPLPPQQDEYLSRLKNQLEKRKKVPYFVDENKNVRVMSHDGDDNIRRENNPIKSKSQFISVDDDVALDEDDPSIVDYNQNHRMSQVSNQSESFLNIEQIMEHNKERLKRLIDNQNLNQRRSEDFDDLEFILNDSQGFSDNDTL